MTACCTYALSAAVFGTIQIEFPAPLSSSKMEEISPSQGSSETFDTVAKKVAHLEEFMAQHVKERKQWLRRSQKTTLSQASWDWISSVASADSIIGTDVPRALQPSVEQPEPPVDTPVLEEQLEPSVASVDTPVLEEAAFAAYSARGASQQGTDATPLLRVEHPSSVQHEAVDATGASMVATGASMEATDNSRAATGAAAAGSAAASSSGMRPRQPDQPPPQAVLRAWGRTRPEYYSMSEVAGSEIQVGDTAFGRDAEGGDPAYEPDPERVYGGDGSAALLGAIVSSAAQKVRCVVAATNDSELLAIAARAGETGPRPGPDRRSPPAYHPHANADFMEVDEEEEEDPYKRLPPWRHPSTTSSPPRKAMPKKEKKPKHWDAWSSPSEDEDEGGSRYASVCEDSRSRSLHTLHSDMRYDRPAAARSFISVPAPATKAGALTTPGGEILHIDLSGHCRNEAGVRVDMYGRPTKPRGCKGSASSRRYNDAWGQWQRGIDWENWNELVPQSSPSDSQPPAPETPITPPWPWRSEEEMSLDGQPPAQDGVQPPAQDVLPRPKKMLPQPKWKSQPPAADVRVAAGPVQGFQRLQYSVSSSSARLVEVVNAGPPPPPPLPTDEQAPRACWASQGWSADEWRAFFAQRGGGF